MTRAASAGTATYPPRRTAWRLAILLALLIVETGLVVSLRNSGWWGTGDNLKWMASAVVAALPVAVAAAIFLHRRFRFGIRGLLAAMTLFALFLFISVRPLLDARAARQGTSALAESGAPLHQQLTSGEFLLRIGFDLEPRPRVVSSRGRIPSWLRPLAGKLADQPSDDSIVEIWLESDAQAAAFAKHAARFTNLQAVGLSNISPRGMVRLGTALPTIPSLTDVTVNSPTPLPDNWLSQLTNVRFLSIWAEGPRRGSLLADDHLRDIALLPNLEVLLVFGYAVNDVNVQALGDSTSLRFIILRHSVVTEAGKRRLSDALPDAKIIGEFVP